MSRQIDASTIPYLRSNSVHMFHLLTMEFSSTVRLTDHSYDIEYDFGSGTETFIANGAWLGAPSVEESIDLSNATIDVSMSGADLANISIALTEDFNDRRVVVRRGFLSDDYQIIKPFIIWDGYIDGYKITEDPQSGNSAVSWTVASHFSDWEQARGRKCNNENAKLHYPDEEGFEFATMQIGVVSWGKIQVHST